MKKDDRQISIRINGKETKLDESNSERETAAAEDREDDFQWVLPDQGKFDKKVIDFQKHLEDRHYGQPPLLEGREEVESFSKKHKKKRFLTSKQSRMSASNLPKKVIYAILAAVTTGLIFGLFMLMLFTQNTIFSETVKKGEQSASVPAGTVQTTGAELDLAVYVVQGGAFSSEEKGMEIVNKIREKGYAAVLDTSEEPIRMFIGLTSSEQSAVLLSDLYKEDGQDTYQKQLKINGGVNYTSEQKAVLASGKQVLEKMLNLTAYQITASKPFNKDEWQEVKNQFQEWEQQLKSISFEESQIKQVEQLKQALQKAVISFHTYASSQEKQELWKTEQLLLDTFIVYKDLLQ